MDLRGPAHPSQQSARRCKGNSRELVAETPNHSVAHLVRKTGTRIAPEIYIAAGISGAIQHWVGAMAAKNILAVNTDAEANMVTKAGYAVIGDLHKVIPAITEEVARRKG